MTPRSFFTTTRALWKAALIVAGSSASADAQSVTREGCTTGDVTVCAQVTLSATASSSNTGLTFDVRNLGVFGTLAQASQPSIVWNFVFATGRDASDVSSQLVTPTGATVTDASPWSFFDVGNQWVLLYENALLPATKGIGSSTAFTGVADVGGSPWSQIGTTGPDAISFSVTVPYVVATGDFDWFQIFGLEATTFAVDGASAVVDLNGTCGVEAPCGAVPATTVPEPSSAALLGLGALLIAAYARRRRWEAA